MAAMRLDVFILAAVVAFFISCSEARVAVQRRELFFFGFPAPGISSHGCWKSIVAVKHCGVDLFSSISSHRLRLGPECCAAIEGISDNCFHSIFTFFPFNPLLPPHVRALCAANINGSTPGPAPVAAPEADPIPTPSPAMAPSGGVTPVSSIAGVPSASPVEGPTPTSI